MEDRANRPFLDRHYLAVGEMLNNLNLDPTDQGGVAGDVEGGAGLPVGVEAPRAEQDRGSGIQPEQAVRGDPLVDLGMRLGEGTGAVYGLSIIGSAAAVSTRMLTFKEAAVSGPGEHR